jgi:uncharacterized protein YecE (DUF72 family)
LSFNAGFQPFATIAEVLPTGPRRRRYHRPLSALRASLNASEDQMHLGQIRCGIGGWSYEPWRETFYPANVTKKDELKYASRQVTAIEINSTFYRMQTPAVFARWREETPEDFIFSLKAPRFIAQRKVLAQAGPFIERFVQGGIAQLGSKLGPILWQLAPTQSFAADDMRAFLQLLPRQVDGLQLRHALEVRHESFRRADFVALAQEFCVAIVFEDDAEHPAIAEITTDFVYARLRRCQPSQPTGYSATDLTRWIECARAWANGEQPRGLQSVRDTTAALPGPRDVFVYFINGAKERAPAAARAFIAGLASSG